MKMGISSRRPRSWFEEIISLDRRVLLFAAFCYILLLPPQLIVNVGVVLPPYRIVLIASAPFVFAAFVAGRVRLCVSDVLMILAAVWIFVSLAFSMGMARAIEAGGAQFLDIAGAYFFARTLIRSFSAFRLAMILVAPGFALTGTLMAIESVSHREIIQPVARAVFGGPGIPDSGGERLGLLRAFGPFPHPILGGMFLGSLLPIYAMSGIRGWPRNLGLLAALCSFFTVSSAAMLALAGGTGLMGAHYAIKKFRQVTWRLFFLLIATILIVAELTTHSGAIGLIIRYASLNPWTAYYRTLIWEYGTNSVAAHPLFGIGYNDWERPMWMSSSVDNYWLLLNMQFGLPAGLALLAVAVIAILAMARTPVHWLPYDKLTAQGLAISLAVFALGLFSVAVWLSAQCWLFVLIAIATTLGSELRQSKVDGSHLALMAPRKLNGSTRRYA